MAQLFELYRRHAVRSTASGGHGDGSREAGGSGGNGDGNGGGGGGESGKGDAPDLYADVYEHAPSTIVFA